MLRNRVVVVMAWFCIASDLSQSFAANLYWTDKDEAKVKFGPAGVEGEGVELLTSADGLVDPRGIALDAANNWMYWADNGTDSIRRARPNLSEVQDVVTGLSFPADVALDLTAEKLYWADRDRGEIGRANLDGANPETVRTGVMQPYYLALDSAQGKVYWSDFDSPVIHRANLDGTGAVENLQFLVGLDRVRDLAVDPAAGKLYWADRDTSKIQRANLDGTGVIEDLYTSVDNLDRPHGLVLDLGHGAMYWTDTATHAVMQGSIDGTQPAAFQDPGASTSGPWGVDLDILRTNGNMQIDAEVFGDVHVLDGGPSAPPTVVELAAPAFVNGHVEAFDASTLNVTGGSMLRDLIAWDSSQVNIISGERIVYDDTVFAWDSSTITISGGEISGDVSTNDAAALIIHGGNISDGVRSADSSTVNIFGGVIFDDVSARDSSVLNVFAGTLTQGIDALDDSRVRITGGQIESLDAGSETGEHASLITIAGSGFNYAYGEILDSAGDLTGVLANGDSIDTSFWIFSNSSIFLVPEPSTLINLVVAAAIVLKLCRTSRQA